MLKFVLLVNKQGQTRLSQYYEYVPVEERVTTEADIVRKCLARNEESVRDVFYIIIIVGRCVFLCVFCSARSWSTRTLRLSSVATPLSTS